MEDYQVQLGNRLDIVNAIVDDGRTNVTIPIGDDRFDELNEILSYMRLKLNLPKDDWAVQLYKSLSARQKDGTMFRKNLTRALGGSSTGISNQLENGSVVWGSGSTQDMLRFVLLSAPKSWTIYDQIDCHLQEILEWVNFAPGVRNCTTDILSVRFRILRFQLLAVFARYLYTNDSKFREAVSKRSPDQEAQTKRSLSGLFAEKIVEFALKPFFGDCDEHQRTMVVDTNQATFIDFVFPKSNVTMKSRVSEKRLYVGGRVAVEVKTGSKGYVAHQVRSHIPAQVAGHEAQQAKLSLVLFSHDFNFHCQSEDLRKKIAEMNSEALCLLPLKRQLDEACVWLVSKAEAETG